MNTKAKKSTNFKAQTFSTLPNRVFLKAKSHFCQLPEGPPLFSIELIKRGKITKNKRFFSLYEDRMLYYKNNKEGSKLKGVSLFDFDLKVEWLFNNPNEEYNPANPPYGFRLLRGSDCRELLFNEPEDFQGLAQFLRKRLNIMNFHYWYKPIKKIGKGNFASVYLVESKETGFQYATKAFLKETLYAQKKGRESIKNEIQVMRALSHLNVIELREVYETENSLYLVMELLKGGNMISYLIAQKAFSDHDTRSFLFAILKAVSHMHERGIMHRDLKPENILLRNKEILESNICVADFGLSSFVNVDRFLFSRCGTPGFVAPEIFHYESGRQPKYTEVCDEFSVGIIFHIMLLGCSVFEGKSYDTIVKENRDCKFDFNKPMYDKINKKAKRLLEALLEPNPAKRITAKMALGHEYFSSEKRASLEEDDFHSVEQKLKSFNQRKFETKHIQELNETLYIPIDLPSRSEFLPSEADSSHFLFTNKPCMNGLLNTCERLNTGRSTIEDVFRFDTSKIISVKTTGSIDISKEKESPGLKNRLADKTTPKICFYQRKSPHKVSDFLDYGSSQLEKFNFKLKENFSAKDGSLQSPNQKEKYKWELSPKKKERTDSFDL